MTVPLRWCGIVEGEPGIFPAPFAGGLLRVNRWVRRRFGWTGGDSADDRDGVRPPSTAPPEHAAEPDGSDPHDH